MVPWRSWWPVFGRGDGDNGDAVMTKYNSRDALLVRYLASTILLAVAWVSVVLLGLYTLIELIREARNLSGDYNTASMAWYVLQTSPRRLYDIFPFAALIGTLIGVGSLAQSNELVAMRAAGVHRKQISGYAIAVIGVCLVGLVAISELFVPALETNAQANRDQARSGEIRLDRHGALWVRDGRYMIRIGHSIWDEAGKLQFSDVLVYELGEALRPEATLVAEQARHETGQWVLSEVSLTPLTETPQTAREANWSLPSTISPELFNAAVTRPRLLATKDLIEMQAFLKDNALDASPYTEALWERVFFPVNVLAMVLIGLPFALGGVFRQSPRGGLGLNVFAGIALGLVFFVLSRLVQGVVTLWPIPIWLGSLLPALLISALALTLLARR